MGAVPAPPPQHDAAGNLISDGKFIYHYDAWNRLIQVNRATVVEVAGRAGGGEPAPPPTAMLAAGDLVKQYVYDALGRLVETRTPITTTSTAAPGEPLTPEVAPGPDGSATPLLAERFYYDGVRRIQETSEVRAALNPPENAQSWTGSTPPGEVVEGSRRFEREYIWGPGDSHAGVDELLALFEGAKAANLAAAAAAATVPSGATPAEEAEARLAAQAAASLAAQSTPWRVIQDASGEVVAPCDNGGPSVPTGLSPPAGSPPTAGGSPGSMHTGRVVRQSTAPQSPSACPRAST